MKRVGGGGCGGVLKVTHGKKASGAWYRKKRKYKEMEGGSWNVKKDLRRDDLLCA